MVLSGQGRASSRQRHSVTGVPLGRVERTWVDTEANEGWGEGKAGNGMGTRTESSWQCRRYLSMTGMRAWDLGVCVVIRSPTTSHSVWSVSAQQISSMLFVVPSCVWQFKWGHQQALVFSLTPTCLLFPPVVSRLALPCTVLTAHAPWTGPRLLFFPKEFSWGRTMV